MGTYLAWEVLLRTLRLLGGERGAHGGEERGRGILLLCRHSTACYRRNKHSSADEMNPINALRWVQLYVITSVNVFIGVSLLVRLFTHQFSKNFVERWAGEKSLDFGVNPDNVRVRVTIGHHHNLHDKMVFV